MKRWIAWVISLVLLLTGTAVLAEEESVAEISWDLYEALVEEAGIEADYVMLEGTGIILWMPDFMMYEMAEEEEESTEETEEPAEEEAAAPADGEEEEYEEDIFSSFYAADGSAYIEVALWELEDDFTLDEMAEEADDALMRVRINGLDGLYMHNEENTVGYLMLMYEPGKIMRFAFYPMDDEEYQEVFRIILASIQKVTVEE